MSCAVQRVVAVAQGQRAKRRGLGVTEAPLLQSRIWRITRGPASLSLNEVVRRFHNSTVIKICNGNVFSVFAILRKSIGPKIHGPTYKELCENM